jgi:hypothetical protein
MKRITDGDNGDHTTMIQRKQLHLPVIRLKRWSASTDDFPCEKIKRKMCLTHSKPIGDYRLCCNNKVSMGMTLKVSRPS